MSVNDCPFCHLDEKTRTVKSGKFSTVILSNPRLMPGHTLVIPSRHVEEPWELTTEELQEIFQHINFVEKKLLASIATGCDVRQNYRPFIPQGRVKVNHVHFHVLPRTLNDELYQASMQHETGLFHDLSGIEQEEMRSLFGA